MLFILAQVAILAATVLSAILILKAYRGLVGRPADAASPTADAQPASYGCVGCVLPLAALFVWYVASLQWGFHVQRQRNAVVAASVPLVATGLNAYAGAHGGKHPAREALADALRPYLAGGRLPADPWSAEDEPLVVLGLDEVPTASGLSGKPWPGAADLVKGAALPELGVHLYGGRRGALIYDVTPDRRVYVLYGLGERSSSDSPFPLKTPRLVAAITNARFQARGKGRP